MATVIATMAFKSFPYWRKILEDYLEKGIPVIMRFDSSGNVIDRYKIQNDVMRSGLLKGWFFSENPWNRVNWREDLLRWLDDLKPDLVITPDQDEIFTDSLIQELGEFWESDKKAMMFSYDKMPTHDGRDVGLIYPSLPHMKAYKWQPGLTYKPYHGLAQPVQYANKAEIRWQARTKIQHYCMYTKEMEAAKREWVMKEYKMF